MENKKKFFLLLILLLLIIGGAFFAFKSCEPRQKDTESSTEDPSENSSEDSEITTDETSTTDSATASDSANFDELSAFINANIEFTCEIIKNPALAENQKESETKVNAVYAKYGLPVDDDKQMIAILKKYEDNNEVISTVQENTRPCKEGNEPIFYKISE